MPAPLVWILVAASALAATSPLEADFPDGYWDREFGAYGGQTAATYTIALVASDPAKTRAEAEAALRAAGGKLVGFTDQTYLGAASAYGGQRARPAYTLSYRLEEAKAGVAARKLIGMGRLLNYSSGTPYAQPQLKEIEERIDWIEKEKGRAGETLRTMPVSRSLLEAKLKRLKASRDALKDTHGTAAVSVQVMREDPEGDGKAAGRSPPPMTP